MIAGERLEIGRCLRSRITAFEDSSHLVNFRSYETARRRAAGCASNQASGRATAEQQKAAKAERRAKRAANKAAKAEAKAANKAAVAKSD
jgi:hypothetical protein